jgi:predicted TPR repeat methyltransferase
LKPLDLASGDLVADRRADYAEMLFKAGEHAAAVEVMLAALELAPGWALGWFRLGEMAEAGGSLRQAREAWQTVLKLDPADRPGAALKLELIGALPASKAPPGAFVEALFDQYAPTFDQALVERLGYRVPELLERAIVGTGRTFDSVVDLGCGTGLMGERLRPLARRLEGIDLSAAMLRRATARGCYDRLLKADLQTAELPQADLVVAADVFMYLGALDGIFARVAAALRPGGLFAFSVEAHDGPEPFVLRASRRYAHGEAGLRAGLATAGLTVLGLARETIRTDRGAPLEGFVVLAGRRHP